MSIVEFRRLISLIRWFTNWREIYSGLAIGAELPPLQLRNRLILHHRPDDLVMMQIGEVLGGKSYRRFITEQHAGTMIDIGANIGIVSLDWATRIADVHVHAYEPNPETFAVLAKNVEANRLSHRITLHPEAVGRETGVMRFYASRSSMLTSAYQGNEGVFAEFRAAMVPLDEVAARATGPIGLLKIDVEGAEGDMLEGASCATLARIQQVAIEYHDQIVSGVRARCEAVLTNAGFRRLAIEPQLSVPGAGILYAMRQ
jgi:FkbM family methyltransferase